MLFLHIQFLNEKWHKPILEINVYVNNFIFNLFWNNSKTENEAI